MNLHVVSLSNGLSAVFRRLAAIACAALVFASCDNISFIDGSEEDERSDEKCTVTFGIAENIGSRAVTGTVLPSSVDTETLAFVLTAALPEDSPLPAAALPADLGAGIDYPSLSALQADSHNLDSGVWIFYLSAYKGGALVLKGEKTVSIQAGPNPVVFDMVASDEGTGSVKVKLRCFLGSETCSEIKDVTASLLHTDGTAIDENILTQQTPQYTTKDEYIYNGKKYTLIEYENNAVPKGSYLLKFVIPLQFETIGINETNSPYTITHTNTSYYTVGVTVEPGSVSENKEDIDIEDLKQRYSITYMNVNDDGTVTPFTYWDSSANPVTYYNPNSTQTVSLPSKHVIFREGKCFTGWYDSYTEGAAGAVGTYGVLTTSFKPKDGGTSTKGAKVYYAKWGDLDLYVSTSETSSLRGGNDKTGDGTISNPYATMAQAFAHIRDNSNDKLAWTVYVDGQVAGMAIDSSAVGTARIDDTDIITIKTLTIRGYTPEDGVPDYIDALVGVSGKALSISISKPVTVKDLTITRGSGASGAGLTVTSSSVVALEGVTVTGNNTQSGESDTNSYDGGGILNEGTLTLENCIITNNRASRNGGGVYNQGTLYIRGNTVIGGDGAANIAGEAGGGIYNKNILITKDANSDAAIDGNIAPSGAGIYNKGGTCSVHNITMSSNTANGTTDENGGGAIWNDGTLELVDVTMTENTTAAAGGAIYSTGTNASLEIEQGVFTLNTAHTSGGAVWSSGDITISGQSTFSSNTATNGSGGAVYCGAAVMATSQVDLSKNHAAESGGAVYAAGAISLVRGNINENTVGNADGGAIYAGASFTVSTAVYMATNQASKGSGGAIYAVGKVSIPNGSINFNEAETAGGAIYIAGTGSELATVTVIGNNAGIGSGGGIYIAEGASATLTGMIIGAENSPNKSLVGGGVYNAGTLTVSGGTIVHNIATASGDAADGDAAGAGIYSTGTLIITGNADVSNNKVTSGWGGGVYNAGIFSMDAGCIAKNTALSGGGVYNSSGCTFTMCDGSIELNKTYGKSTSDGGGGVYNAGIFTMGGGVINGNEVLDESENACGGGVYNKLSAKMFMYSSALIGLKEGVSANADSDSDKHSNYAASNGGGIYNLGDLYLGYSDESTTVPLENGLYYNYSDGKGGGIYHLHQTSTPNVCKISSGDVLYNENRNYRTSGLGGDVQYIEKGNDANIQNNTN